MITLLLMQTKHTISQLETELVKTEKQKIIYHSLDGKKSMEEIKKLTGVSVKTMEPLLPEWEKRGLILSFGKGKSKRYANLENIEI